MNTAFTNNDYLNEIVRLQLKKPKRWNWELTTCRSSPNITLPVIQLYNAKGKLLVEAKESGSERRSWHSNDIVNNRCNTSNDDKNLKPLQKCTSDILNRNKYETISTKVSPNQYSFGKGTTDFYRNFAIENNKFLSEDIVKKVLQEQALRHRNKSSTLEAYPSARRKESYKYAKNKSATILGVPNNTDINKMGLDYNSNFLSPSYSSKNSKITGTRSMQEDFQRSENIRGPIKPVKKSKSAVIRFADDTKDSSENTKPKLSRYKRSESDDLFKKISKHNEESAKRAVADGYQKFLNSEVDKVNNNANNGKIKKEIALNHSAPVSKFEKPEINRVKYNKYVTRTCSAGTLVIKEESFSNPNIRRRRKTAEVAADGTLNGKQGKNVNLTRKTSLATDISYPHMISYTNQQNGPVCERKDSLKLPAYNLFHSKSDILPSFDNNNKVSTVRRGVSRRDEGVTSCRSNSECNYTVQEPNSENSRKNSEDIGSVEKLAEEKLVKRKRRRKVRRRSSDGSASSETSQHNERGNNIKARVIKEHKKDAIGDGELLRLVRGLSNDHVKMGANVSRHSSKGLSGRRTQSSGSICNGKGNSGRHTNSEPKICGSLPSYLDDRNSGCNNNHHEKPPLEDIERIPPLGDGAPLHWKFSDTQTALCDQGYGSERSPEEEYPPPLPEHDNQCHHHLDLHSCYPFITPESTFTVSLAKGSRGLGLSVTGGVDSGGSWPGLIRVKRLFPHQPASSCEMLNVGDLILEVNGITLTGLTNYEALEVLRTASNQVELKICRPPPDVLSCVSPISEVPPPPPRRDPPSSLNLTSSSDDEHGSGEFEVTMRKLQGSLGFTLRKEDDSALGHYIRALVREPALTDARIRAGDKIIAVNDVEISSMTHEEAVQFLRQSGEIVKLRLYRDLAQTPVATLSPTETTPRTSFSKKTQLRQEAVDMLNDIAVRKLIPGNQDIYSRRSQSPNTSPRRLRRQPCPSDASHISDSSSKHLITDEQFHEGLLKKCSLPLDEDSFNSLFIEDDDCDRPSRPSSLDLYNPNQTPVAARKPKFNFSLAHNAYELNNLDAEILDAPNLTYNLGNDDANSTEVEIGDSFPQEPASMPHIPTDNPGFSYKNPAYQSAHPQCCTENSDDNKTPKTATDDTNMRKWKGVVFPADEERERERQRSIKIKTPKKEEEKYVILAIELNRGWNSRLGFSLQGAAGVTYVSAVHADSVAARDGRIKPGDCLIKVNDESVENMTTSEIIDLLRIVRGPVCIVVSRTKSKEDCIKSNAAN